MHFRLPIFLVAAALCLAACNNEGRTDGNGPGNADGFGGREDPPAATTDQSPNDASTVDPEGAMTTPDGSTEDTGATPRDPVPGNQGR
jgi:hypothetical protein